MPKLNTWVLLLSGWSMTALAQPADLVDQQQWLLEQVRMGEALHRDDLVRDSLARLQLIAPNDPRTLLALIRQALREDNRELAKQRLAQLHAVAPDSDTWREAQALIQLQDPPGPTDLQQAQAPAAPQSNDGDNPLSAQPSSVNQGKPQAKQNSRTQLRTVARQPRKAPLNSKQPARNKKVDWQHLALQRDELNQQAEAATARHDWPQVVALREKIRTLTPNDPWATYHLAKAFQQNNQPGAADEAFKQLMQQQSNNPEAAYAYALYLSSSDRDASALRTLEQVPEVQWSPSMGELHSRLQRTLLVARAHSLRKAGQEPQAIALLMQNPTRDDLITVADWAQERGDYAKAQALYRQVLKQDPENTGARLGVIETLIADQQLKPARQQLEQFNTASGVELAPWQLRRLANAWADVGEPDKARALYAHLLKTPQSDPLIYRDAARLLSATQPQLALDYYAKSMAGAGLLSEEHANPRDNRALTRASRAKDSDQWLERSLRSDVDALYQRQTPTVHLYTDYGWRADDASAGTSDTDTQTTILQADLPMADGVGFVRAEHINMDAGRFDTDSDGRVREGYGTCAVGVRRKGTQGPIYSGCDDRSQTVDGTLMAAGWKNQSWNVDIGRTPDTFKVPNWLGGVAYSSKLGSVGWTLTGSRRPLSNSIVSYAGATDPATGVTWGGVTANGLTLDLSHDEGGVDGVWASLGQHWLKGKNVQDNHKTTAMAGYYYRLVERADERLRTGLTLMYWGYDKDLSEYTLGQGGYYSPQHYYSIGVPLTYAFRTANWSVSLESSVGWSYAKSRGNDLYPLSGLNDKLLNAVDQAGFEVVGDLGKTQADNNNGIGIQLQGLVERRLSDHLVLGGGVLYQHSEDYAPSRAMLYLRYTFDPWQGNLPLPVQPLIPYAQFR